VSTQAFCSVYVGTLAGRSAAQWQPLCEAFLHERIEPRLLAAGRACVEEHRRQGHELVLTTATNRVVSELTAADLGVDHYLCTELEVVNGRYTGRTAGVVNMRTGKLERLRRWLAERGESEQLLKRATFYSDSINDLVLLSVVGRPVVVDPDPRLESAALRKGWTALRLQRDRQGP
jgi:HAD superfamily hydrolase (TIGR01490 family)